MAERFKFFDSIDGTDERYYTADEFAEYFRQFIRNGIFNGGENLKVGTDGVNIKTYIKPGYAWIEGYLYKIDIDILYLEHSTAHSSLDRVDRVIIRLDKTLENRYIKAFVLEGTPSGVPIPVELTRNNNIFEIALAQVRIIAGKSYIEAYQILDERLDNTVCGLVTHLIDQVNTTEIFNQFQAWLDSKTAEPNGDFYRQWKDWFEGLQNITNLVTKTQFDEHKSDTVKYTEYKTTIGTANALTVNVSGTFDLAKDGNILNINPSLTNTAAATINPDAQGVKNIKKFNIDTNAYVDIEAGDIKKNQQTALRWDLTQSFFVLAPKGGGSTIKSIQCGNGTQASGTAITNVTITAVDLSKAVVMINFHTTSSNGARRSLLKAKLTTATNLQITRTNSDFTAVIYSYTVVEYDNLKSLQKGDYTLSTATAEVSVSVVNLGKSYLVCNWETTNVNSDPNFVQLNYYMLNSSTIRFNMVDATWGNHGIHWQLLEFK